MRILLILTLVPLLSCNPTPDDKPTVPLTEHSHAVTESDEKIDESKKGTYVSYHIDTTGLSPEPETPVKILMEGAFHKEEVWEGAEKKQWFGLFKENGRYLLKPTTIQIVPSFDRVADAKRSGKNKRVISGREVIGTAPNALFFINGLATLTEGEVDSVEFSKSVLPIGKSLSLELNNRSYTITAFGDSILLPAKEYSYQNYGWKVSGIRKGKAIEQVLAQDDFFDDSIYVLLWAGDLDRDGIPDLLIDVSNHFNKSEIALFMSSMAKKGKLYDRVATFATTGI